MRLVGQFPFERLTSGWKQNSKDSPKHVVLVRPRPSNPEKKSTLFIRFACLLWYLLMGPGNKDIPPAALYPTQQPIGVDETASNPINKTCHSSFT